jgi:hypothetical protein
VRNLGRLEDRDHPTFTIGQADELAATRAEVTSLRAPLKRRAAG